MIITYLTERYNATKIKRRIFSRETAHYYITERGEREAKTSHYHKYHATWADAKAYLIARLQDNKHRAYEEIARIERELSTLSAMEYPSDSEANNG